MDIVYILGTGSKWNNNEIRYSLRSLSNLPHGKVFVVGELLPWFDNIIHIPASDPFTNKQQNALHKLSITAALRNLSNDFILMNDDFFILRKQSSIKPYYRRTLEEAMEQHQAKGSRYFEAIQNTYEMYPNGLDYSLHIPFVFNKTKLRKTIKHLEGLDKPVLLRTVYGNMHKIGGEQMDDVKLCQKDWRRQRELPNLPFLSTDDQIVRKARFEKAMKRRFPAPSVYERPMK